MNSIPRHRAEHRYEEISLLAYHLWQQAHCPPGEDLKFWLQAEEQLFGKRERQAAAKAKAAGTPKSLTQSAGNGPTKSQPKAAKPQSTAK